jgi:hypothetical protein
MKRVIHINHYHVSMTTFNDDSTVVHAELVPGKRYEFHHCPAHLTVRMQSTRAGNNAWWACGSNAASALNDAPYCPVLRARITVFEWRPPASKDNIGRFNYVCWEDFNREEFESAHHGQYIFQAGSHVLNWFAIVAEPIPDPLREKIRNLISDIFESEWALHARSQGHLQVLPLVGHHEKVNDILEHLPGGGSGFRALYNHHVYPVARWAWRAIDGTAYAVFVPWAGEVIVTSPDHEEQYLRIYDNAARLYLARHPVPRPERGVD